MKRKIKIFPIILSFLSLLYSEEIGNIYYSGDIGELKDSTITVSEKAVALSSKVRAFPPFFIPEPLGTPSLLFIIDHSSSMSGSAGNDHWGKRFTFSLELIDSIKTRYPSLEVSIAVFREHLYFDPTDDSRFVQCPGYDTGAYLPFLKLDSSYAPIGETGYQIVKKYLESDTVTDSLGHTYVDLQYKPSNIAINSGSANINVGFAAARHAFQSALYAKNRQFIFFLSDGEANEFNGPNTSPWDFVNDVTDIPTTFTIFFTSTGQAPQNLITMTKNIQSNVYSTNNSYSDLWAIDNDSLMQLLLGNILTIICTPYVPLPVSISINGDQISVYDTLDSSFTFDNYLPLTGETTDFSYIVKYQVGKDSVIPNGDTIFVIYDSLSAGAFIIAIENGADLPDHYPHEFLLNRWDRNLRFYYKDNPVSSINKGMDTIEIRFNEKEIDILYDYDSVSVTITNSKGNIDSETFKLSKTDTCFTKLFPLAIDSTPTQNDGILQLFDRDTVTAVFRNPKLPLDTLELSVPFYPTTAINPNSYINQKILFLNIINSSILFNLPTSGKTRLQIYNINGRLVSNLVDSYKQSGEHKVDWECDRYGSGIYYLKLSTDKNSLIRKAIVIK